MGALEILFIIISCVRSRRRPVLHQETDWTADVPPWTDVAGQHSLSCASSSELVKRLSVEVLVDRIKPITKGQ